MRATDGIPARAAEEVHQPPVLVEERRARKVSQSNRPSVAYTEQRRTSAGETLRATPPDGLPRFSTLMPQFLEDKLKQTAAKKGLKGRRAAAYVYGTMNNIGAMRGNKVTAKGERMQRKHDEDRGAMIGLGSMKRK